MSDHELPWLESVEVAPGLRVARRGFLGTVAASCAAAALPGSSTSWRTRLGEHDWTIEEFVRAVTPVCKELVADTSARGQDRYLFALASHAVQLGTVPEPEMREVGSGHRIGANHGPDPFTVLHWTLAPKAVITPHAHTYGNVVTIGMTGSARVSNYEVVGVLDIDTKDGFEVVRTVEQVLRPGDVNLVSLQRHYVHGFAALATGASGLDITTRIVPKRRSPVLEVGDATDAAAGRFAARWRQGE